MADTSNSGPQVPFGKLALTFSGGGFRATAFGLGVMSYLNSVNYKGTTLLERVELITSASGGTLPAILYSAYRYKGIAFERLYKKIRNEILHDSKLAEMAVKNLNDDKVWERYPTKTRNTINAFAIAYNETFLTLDDGTPFDGADFSVYFNTPDKATDLEMCFNSSEFVNGRTFRFQTDNKTEPEGLLGNLYLRVTPINADAVKKLRLGDIMAASSCFPGGFEPIIFPDDFARDETHRQQLLGLIREAEGKDKYGSTIPRPKSFSLMDGGVTDNQGVESMELSFDRAADKGEPFDLVLVCDVANYFIDAYETPTTSTGILPNMFTLNRVTRIFKFSFIPLVVFLLLGLKGYCPYITYPLATFSGLLSLIYVALAFSTNLSSYKKDLGANLWNKTIVPLQAFLTSRKISTVMQFAENRAMSVAKILTDIQLLQIRRLNYDYIFTYPAYNLRIKMVSIYKLSTGNINPLKYQNQDFINPGMTNQGKLTQTQVDKLAASLDVMETAEAARKMGTTLWFGDDDIAADTRDKIIACGQFTTCNNLLEYAYALRNDSSFAAHWPDIDEMIIMLERDWDRFNGSALWMV